RAGPASHLSQRLQFRLGRGDGCVAACLRAHRRRLHVPPTLFHTGRHRRSRKMTTTLTGTFPVLPTPFRDDGSIDDADFLSVIDFVLESGVDGVVYPGVASEVDTLTAEERDSQVEILATRIGGRVPIVIGASDPDPQVAARHLAK